jgi:hypothetical protein
MQENFITNWEETWSTCLEIAVNQGNKELAEKIKRFRDVEPDEEFDKEEFLDVIRQAKALLANA